MVFIHDTSIVDKSSKIGDNTRIWHFCHIMHNVIIGNNVIVGQNCFIANDVHIGNGVKIQNNVSIYKGVIIENNVFVGPSVVFTNVINPRAFIERKEAYQTTLVKKGASIGANATIICSNTIGNYAMIGAGSVVTKTVKDYALVVGNPAKQIAWVSKAGNTLQFNEQQIAYCDESKEHYQIVDNNLVVLQE
ncbi:MAG: N-acetyltransferase [Chitinophagales bacterium]|nr:N-acetyltransferase [Chitinophagales bacterium]